MADIAFNRNRPPAKGTPDLYFFWQSKRADQETVDLSLTRALALQPGSPKYNFAQGLSQVESIREKILSAARQRARALYLLEASARPADDEVQALANDISEALEEDATLPDEETEEFRELVLVLTDPARRGMLEEIRADLEVAERSFQEAMRMAPTVPWYRMGLAMSYADLLGPDLAAEKPKVDALVAEALALAPSRPDSLFSAARYYARGILKKSGGLDASRERDGQVLAMFRKAVHAEPWSYADPTYEFLVGEAGADPGLLFEITPETLRSQRRLEGFCSRRGLWPEALEAAGNVLSILGIDPQSPSIPEMEPDSVEFRVGASTTRQQVRTLQRLGMIEPWRVSLERYRAFLRMSCDALLEDASRYASMSRLAEARKSCTDCLEHDWNHLDAFLKKTEIELLPGAFPDKNGEAGLLQELLRLGEARPEIGGTDCERIEGILRQLTPETPIEHLEAKLVEAVLNRWCGDLDEAVRILRALLLVDAKPFLYWHQRHLIHYHLGRALEMAGSEGEAVSEYEQALEYAPSHMPSLERLVGLGFAGEVLGEGKDGTDPAGEPMPEYVAELATVGDRLQALTPEQPWGVDMGGRVALLGQTFEGTGGESGFTARYFWQITSDLDPTDYHVGYRYFDEAGDPIYREWRNLFTEPGKYGESLDGGIGTVLMHWHYLPIPREIPAEVRILVGKKRKGKFRPPSLRTITGDRWLILGLPSDEPS